MIYENLRTYLLTKSSVTDLVAQRIYPLRMPQTATLPAVVMRQSGQHQEHQLSGATGVTTITMDLYCYSDTLAGAVNLAEQLRLVLHGYKGDLDTLVGVFIQLADIEDEAIVGDEDEIVYGRSITFDIKCRHAIPA